MTAALAQVDQVLRSATPLAAVRTRRALPQLVFFILGFGIFYGAVMGCYGGVGGEHVRQPLYSGVKVPILLLITFGLSIPSFYVLNLLMGLAEDFAEVLRALIATQAVLTIVLASLAPFTVLWYASFTDHDHAILFNAGMFAVASFTAQWVLRRYYRPLISRNERHRWLLRLWLVIYAFVGIQMGWVLRPFIGDPGLPTTFFRADSWGNAYVFVVTKVWEALGGR
jgi:hypothetical protein